MKIGISANLSSRAAYAETQPKTVQTEKKTDAPVIMRTQDEITISPKALAEFRAQKHDASLVINQNREVDPDGSIALKTYMRAYAQPAVDARKAITEYYADAHKENSSYPFMQGLEHIAQKYKRPDSDIFRADLSKEERDMCYRQERALLTGARVTLFDPYALASVGGIQNAQTSHQLALKAVQDKMDELRKNFD